MFSNRWAPQKKIEETIRERKQKETEEEHNYTEGVQFK